LKARFYNSKLTLVLAVTLVACAQTSQPEGKLILATTTSTYDSGLLDEILPAFEETYDIEVDIVAVGTGQAIALGEAGDADVLLVHAPSKEESFVADGHGVERVPVMHNDFVILGPAEDPAGIAGMERAAATFAQIASAQAEFVSRGDESGTHAKEQAIWAEAGIEPGSDWYLSAGQGMGAVLTLADEQRAYTLSDRGTYLARLAEGLQLEVLVEGDPLLFNPYSAIAVDPEAHPGVNQAAAGQFIDWLTSVETQETISSFERFGQPLFTPDSAAWRAAQ
jgi:tungstate transport system substrate-binding protein